jgi:hypothetical protein
VLGGVFRAAGRGDCVGGHSFMTNEQLSVLLFHILRQINEATNDIEVEFGKLSVPLDVIEKKTFNLRTLADVLHQQAGELLGKTVGSLR